MLAIIIQTNLGYKDNKIVLISLEMLRRNQTNMLSSPFYIVIKIKIRTVSYLASNLPTASK